MKQLKWITFLTAVVLVLITPLAIRADDEDEQEWLGTISSRPEGRTGAWVIGVLIGIKLLFAGLIMATVGTAIRTLL